MRLHTTRSLWILGSAGCLLLAGCEGPALLGEMVLPLRRVPHFVQTKDGWLLAVHRYKPETVPEPALLPVVLCHGLGYNSRFWDLTSENNFAGYLSKRGFDVWLVDLRGSGFSTRPGWAILHGPQLHPLRILQTRFDKVNWTIDDHILHDIPAVIELVKRETGRPAVHWVGHSLGGFSAYGHLMRGTRNDFHALVTIGSPLTDRGPLNRRLALAVQLGQALTMVSQRLVSQWTSLGAGYVENPSDVLFFNADNMYPSTISRLHGAVAEDVSQTALDQQLTVFRKGALQSTDGRFNYAEHLDRVTVPVLLLVGKVDNVARVEAVRDVYRRVGSTDKTFHVCGRANGFAVDYGHDDMILGIHAPAEVFPMVERWIRRHDPATAPAAVDGPVLQSRG